MAGQLLQAGHTLITLARSPLPLPPQPLATHLHWPHDLTAPEAAAGQLLAWLQACRASDYASATLINNAAMIPPSPPCAPPPGQTLPQPCGLAWKRPWC